MTHVAVGNVRNNPPMPQASVVHDIDLLFHQGQVVLACEIGIGRYKEYFATAAGASGRKVFHLGTADPVAVPCSWPETYGESHRLTKGLAGVNPSRYFNAVFRPGAHMVYVSTHFTNGAWNDKLKPSKLWRKWAWRKQEAKAAALVAGWHDAGWTVVIGGDMNRMQPPKFHAEQRTVLSDALMHLVVVPAGGQRVVVSESARQYGRSDHAFISARLRKA